MPEKGWNFAIFMEHCVCVREGVELCYIHWTLCLCQRRGGTLLYSWNAVFVPEKGWNFAIFMEHCVCVREGVELCYIHGSVLVLEKGWNSGYIHVTLCLLPEEGWNAGYIYGTAYHSSELWILPQFPPPLWHFVILFIIFFTKFPCDSQNVATDKTLKLLRQACTAGVITTHSNDAVNVTCNSESGLLWWS